MQIKSIPTISPLLEGLFFPFHTNISLGKSAHKRANFQHWKFTKFISRNGTLWRLFSKIDGSEEA